MQHCTGSDVLQTDKKTKLLRIWRRE